MVGAEAIYLMLDRKQRERKRETERERERERRRNQQESGITFKSMPLVDHFLQLSLTSQSFYYFPKYHH
jgi:hypothetical protein